jgi:hypothetical protein
MAKKMKPLSHLKNTAKGEIHHMEIHPAQNSAGKLAFLTRTMRKPAPAMQAANDAQGRYTPEYSQDGADAVHENGNDMLAHVGNTYGIKPEDDGDADDMEQGQGE